MVLFLTAFLTADFDINCKDYIVSTHEKLLSRWKDKELCGRETPYCCKSTRKETALHYSFPPA